MKRTTICVAAMLALLLLIGSATAEGIISTTVVMRVSKMTQDAIVNVGEDLSMEVSVDGVVPASYQWYFNDAEIPGADQRVHNIVDARMEDAGVYRLDAFSEDGRMLLSMDIAARVMDDVVPKSGDASLPVGFAFGLLGLSALALLWKLLAKPRRAA